MNNKLNNKNLGTKARFIKTAGLISAYMADRIDKDQAIKRYLIYNTKNPLGKRGLNYDGQIVVQNDIDYSLIDANIYDGMFNEDMESTVQNQIYIHVFKGNNENNYGKVYCAINVLVSKEYENLSNFGEKRTFCISDRLEELLHDVYIDTDNADKDLVKECGNLHFKLLDFTNSRLSKTNNIVLHTLVFETEFISRRV